MTSELHNKLSCAGIILVIFLLPIARGGTLIWPQALALVIIGAICISLALFYDFSSTENQRPWLYPWLVITAIIIIQLVPFKSFDLDELEPFKLKTRISAMPLMTINYWVLFSFFWIIAWMVSRLEKSLIILIVTSIAVLLCFEMIYGVVAYINNYQEILGVWSLERKMNVATGTFLNRNHYAALFVVSTPIVLSLLLTRQMPEKFSLTIRLCLGLLLLLFFSLVVYLSYSRLGLSSFLFAILLWVLLSSGRLGLHASRKKYILYLSVVLLLILVAGVWIGLEPTLHRFEGLGENNRYLLWQTVLDELPSSFWLWGMGAGTVMDNFKMINPLEINRTVLQLHNDWLEFFLDFGLIGSTLIIISFIYWFKTVKPKQFTALQLGASSGIIAIAIHSIADFPLQIPGVAVLFWTMVGIVMNKQLLHHSN